MLTHDSVVAVETEIHAEPQDLATPPPPPATEPATDETPQREPLPGDTFRIVATVGALERLARELCPIVRRDVLVGAEVNVGRAVWDRLIVPVDAPELAPPTPHEWLAARLPHEANPVAFAADAIAGRVQRPFPEGPNSLRGPLLEAMPRDAATLIAALSLAPGERDNNAREWLRKLRHGIASTPGALTPADKSPRLVSLLRAMLAFDASDDDFAFAGRVLGQLDALAEPKTLATLLVILGRASRQPDREPLLAIAANFIAQAVCREVAA